MLGSWPHGLLQDAALVALEALQNEPDETLLVNLRKMQSLRKNVGDQIHFHNVAWKLEPHWFWDVTMGSKKLLIVQKSGEHHLGWC